MTTPDAAKCLGARSTRCYSARSAMTGVVDQARRGAAPGLTGWDAALTGWDAAVAGWGTGRDLAPGRRGGLRRRGCRRSRWLRPIRTAAGTTTLGCYLGGTRGSCLGRTRGSCFGRTRGSGSNRV